MSTVKPHRFIWFCRNDLRLHDNPCLTKIMAHKGPKEVLPVYLFDPRMYATTRRGSPKTGKFRAKFLYESVSDLRSQLRSVGSDLLVDFDLMMTIPLLGPFFLTMTQLSMPWVLRFLYTPEF